MEGNVRKRRYICSYEDCKASFNRAHLLESHINLHTNQRPYICSFVDCDKSYTLKQHLKRHENIHKKKYMCTEEHCEQTFISDATLKKHVDNVHLLKKPKTYKCSYCDEQFNKHSWLKQHEYRHTGEKPYVCFYEGCDKRFTHPSKLKRHFKIHKGYTCTNPDCNETFSKWTLYQKHLKVTHAIIFKCEICGKQFSKIGNLKEHFNVHENSESREIFKCPHPNCSRFYFAQRNLTYHMKSYHDERPFVCKEENCYKTFKTEDDMTRHYKWRHDPYTRLRKKKKRRKPKPSFAAFLSGSVQKEKRKTDAGKQDDKVVSQELDSEPCPNVPKEKHSSEYSLPNNKEKTDESELEIEVLPSKDKCLNIRSEKDEGNIRSDAESSTSDIDEGIQTLLNMINERNSLDPQKAVPKAQYVSFKEFIKL